MLMSSLQLSGFVEKYTGSGMNLHPQSSSNKDNRRTEGLNRYLKTLQSNESTAPGQRFWLTYYQVFQCFNILYSGPRVEFFLIFCSMGKADSSDYCSKIDLFHRVQWPHLTSRSLQRQRKHCLPLLSCSSRHSFLLSPTATPTAEW